MKIPLDRDLTPEVLREYASRLETIEKEFANSDNCTVWCEEFDETLRHLDFEVFNMLDKHDIQRGT